MKASERTWICNNRCRAMHRLKTYLPNDAAAAEEMVDVFCAECLAQTQEEDDRVIGTVNLKENAELICEILNADAEGRVWRLDDEPVRHGQWEIAIGYDPRRSFQCSKCLKMSFENSRFCPSCGAKMDGKEKRE